MRCRTLAASVALALLAGLLVSPAGGQPPTPARIGVVLAESADRHPPLEAFRAALRDLGYDEGRTIQLELRWAGDRPERFADLVRDLAGLPVQVIVAGCTAAALAAKQAAPAIPIVMAAGLYPVERGLVASLARPGGTVTGVALPAGSAIEERLDLLKHIQPRISSVALLWTRDRAAEATLRDHQNAAVLAGVQLRPVEIGGAGDLATAIEAAARDGARALTTADAPLFSAERRAIAELALRHRLPSISGVRGYAAVGGLVEYAPSPGESWTRAATFVDRLLRGARAADLPVEEPIRLELTINVTTARALGIGLPPTLLLRAPSFVE